MLVHERTLLKLGIIAQRYDALRYHKLADIEMEMIETMDRLREEPQDGDWQPAPVGLHWGKAWGSAWFRGDVLLPDPCQGRKVLLHATIGGPRAKTAAGEGLFLVDGQQRGVFDVNHPAVVMCTSGEAGRRYHVALEVYAGHSYPGHLRPDQPPFALEPGDRVFGGMELLLEREDVSAFLFDLRTLMELMEVLDEHSLRRAKIVAGLAQVWETVDAMPSERREEQWRPKLAQAREVMRPLLEAVNGSTAPWFGLIGHSHLDTIWLWTLDETYRKCARTFSSALNLLEQYPEFMFVQSAAAHADMMRREYPGIYARIKERVAEGRWEPNGAMWVESDCNLPAGECLIRQFLFGQRATQEMFGYTSDMLWLPDVFGYPGSLPQLMRGCGVEFFCTQKIRWSDTTLFPYDSFHWRGIDGTAVVAHQTAWNSRDVGPKAFVEQWRDVQHKDVQDRRCYPFGAGDGGGGPTAEQIEMARRLGDLEGCPRSQFMTVSEFMRGMRDELDLPTYVGETYLQAHRGTLTAISEIKRRNRRAEWAFHDAEFLSVLAALQGQPWPADQLRPMWETLLTRHFHDVLPGTSIAEVNDKTLAEFDRLTSEAQGLQRQALTTLCGACQTDSRQLTLINTLSWPREGVLALRDMPEGLLPTGPGVTSQQVIDAQGDALCLVDGLTVPALGAAALQLSEAAPTQPTSDGFELGDQVLTTPFATITLGDRGIITSFVDRATGRELVKEGGWFNAFWLGEDLPYRYDVWDIDPDQALKMALAGELVQREWVAQGPLQWRLRSEYRLGEGSLVTQDMVLHAHTPQVDFETVVDWNERHKLLRVGFDVNLWADLARYDIQFGHMARPTHSNEFDDRARFEACLHKWMDLSEPDFGLALLNDGKYGGIVQHQRMQLTLLSSASQPDPRYDVGRHVFTYSLLPHQGPFSVPSVVRPAYELNEPLLSWRAPEAASIAAPATVEASNVIVEWLKWAEDEDGIVLRLYEAGKQATTTCLTLGVPATAVVETDMLECPQRELPIKDGAVTLRFRPFEIKTLLLRL